MRRISTFAGGLLTILCIANLARAEFPPVNEDEAKVPAYTLPDPLVMANGEKVTDADTWFNKRRPEIFKLFESEIYGRVPAPQKAKEYVLVERDAHALNGLATRKQVSIILGDGKDAPRLEMLMYLPNDAKGPVPTFLGLNFHGNHTTHTDPAILLPRGWVHKKPELGVNDHQAQESSRGVESRRWPIEMIIKRGYGLATIYYGDIDPDFDDGFKNGVHPLFYKPGQTKPAPDEAGAIGAWAWGLSRALDYLETDADVDAKRVALIGHSRLGKTALWAGAQDPRFALVISNNSGCGGAALWRRKFGEVAAILIDYQPHWFCDNFDQYRDKDEQIPVDQHMLIGLIAPRPVYVASASEDLWADPRGEFLAIKNAESVYALLGKGGLPFDEQQQPREVTNSALGYHLRPGKHDILEYDWERYLDFADQQIK
jgi:hypothetical protein